MKQLRKAKITGTGRYIPDRLVTNHDLEKIMDTSDEWIQQRSGIKTRYYAEEHQSTSDLGFEAAKKAIEDAGLEPKDIDLIIAATLSPDYYFPGIGVLIQHKLGLSTTPALDVRNQCCGFIYGLSVAKAFIESSQYNRILVVGAELHSKLINMSTKGREVTVLFGDGAGAVVVEAAHKGDKGELLSCHLHSQGEHAGKLWIEKPGPTRQRFITPEEIELGLHYPYMEGRAVFKHATSRVREVLVETLEHNSIAIENIDHFLFHQANIRINEMVAKMLSIPEEKIHNNIDKYGNCSAGSLPILLDETLQEGKIRRGDLVCFAAFGAGFTWASALARM